MDFIYKDQMWLRQRSFTVLDLIDSPNAPLAATREMDQYFDVQLDKNSK
jgi:hypothetical protein